MKLEHFLTLCTKINSKWIKDLNVVRETIKLPEENTGSKRLDTGLGNEFSDSTPKAKATKATINKWDYIKLKSCCAAEEIINRVQPTEWEEMSANY